METKFTKGKWIYRKGNTDQFAGVIFGGYSLNISDNDFKIDEENANALLISKSPEMYKRLEDNILILQNTLSYFNNIRKYINACDVHKFKNNYKLIEDEKNKIEQLLKEATEL